MQKREVVEGHLVVAEEGGVVHVPKSELDVVDGCLEHHMGEVASHENCLVVGVFARPCGASC